MEGDSATNGAFIYITWKLLTNRKQTLDKYNANVSVYVVEVADKWHWIHISIKLLNKIPTYLVFLFKLLLKKCYSNQTKEMDGKVYKFVLTPSSAMWDLVQMHQRFFVFS